ncbi:MAG: translation initiation factor IF-3 [Deltaproteobacteria bacterium GWA2_38_16]|nr:MAG: translation initiation factor IF-3 [Deltaproteobacteria bacterium GWA2_38_16]OGQ03021.1 MAG: translation initiation factor IF-3 [Deltaproteobacteria bacterium RIFCSPHIGHO2_02_FULL_38_15]OGQ61947.1 MAG: translation initiation factor IF-3 [Deltaproteobacteria bacterium RIFCSPLOWO2_12_FULL_38_8]
MAMDQGLDLVEVAPQAKPPVCKIIDYGKYLYELKKEQQKAKKKQVVIKLHEIKFGIGTDEHDIDHKLRKIHEFLTKGDKVKLTVVFRGREMEHKELGKIVLDKITEKLKDIAVIEQMPKQEGKMLFSVVAPARKHP